MDFIKVTILITVTLSFCVFQGCTDLSTNSDSTDSKSDRSKSDQLILGKKLQDPYTVESMKKALVSLAQKKDATLGKKAAVAVEEIDLQPNYLYVKFLPQGRLQEGILQNHDTSLVLISHPLDYEVIQDGAVPERADSIKEYYAAVPIGYTFCSQVQYEVLKELFLIAPYSDSLDSMVTLAKKTTNTNVSLVSLLASGNISAFDLETESLRLTGNLATRLGTSNLHDSVIQKGLSKSSALFKTYRPAGTITFQDTVLGRVPLVGARVTSGYWYSWTSSTTNATGYFKSSSTWYYGVDFELHFDASDFVIQKNGVIHGPHGARSDWNLNIGVGKWSLVASIFTAAYNYYYNNIEDLSRPHQNSWYNSKLDLEVFDEDGTAQGMYVVVPIWLAQSIKIWLKKNGTYRTTDRVYGTASHELAHNAHFQNFKTRNWALPRDVEYLANVTQNVTETFARGIEWRFSIKRYPNTPPTWQYFRYINDKTNYDARYSGLIEDLVDNITTHAQKNDYGYDLVQGFTMKQIENAVMESFDWGELKNNLNMKYPANPSTGLIYTTTDYDNLFDWWYNDIDINRD